MTMRRGMLLGTAMRSTFYFHIFALVSLCTAKNVQNVQATGTQVAVPASLITPAPVIHGDIFKRAIATCGFVRGDSASPLTCPDNYNCITTIHAQPAFACCNNIECLGNWGVCQEYGQNNCQGYDLPADTCSSIYGSILQCSQDAPHCFRYARSTALGGTDTYYSYACGTATSDILLLATATNGESQPTEADNNDPLASLSSLLNPSVPGLSVPGATDTSSTGSRPSTSSTSKNPLSTTAIALIVVFGGAALIAALVIGYCCWRRRHRRNTNIVYHPMPPQLPYQPTVTQGPGPGSIHSWNSSIPPGANPNIAPSVVPSDYSGATASEMRPQMTTLYEGQRSY